MQGINLLSPLQLMLGGAYFLCMFTLKYRTLGLSVR